jgi:hypothetical protein
MFGMARPSLQVQCCVIRFPANRIVRIHPRVAKGELQKPGNFFMLSSDLCEAASGFLLTTHH